MGVVFDPEFLNHGAGILVGLRELEEFHKEGVVAVGKSLGFFNKILSLAKRGGCIRADNFQSFRLAIEVDGAPSQHRGVLPKG